MKYFYVYGYAYPFWATYEHDGNTDVHNLEADTDMGDLSLAEFHGMFPHALEIPGEKVQMYQDAHDALRELKEKASEQARAREAAHPPPA